MGYYTSIWGVGFMAGPLIGSTLYALLGFKFMFYIYGGIELLLGFVVRYNVKNSPILTY